MLRVYTRHYGPCKQTSGDYRRCHCPKWINGTLPTGEFVRVAAKTRSWENAERKARLASCSLGQLACLFILQEVSYRLRRLIIDLRKNCDADQAKDRW